MTGIIYCYTNKINGKKYIGQTVHKPTARAGRDGYRYNKKYKFGQAIEKYSLEAFIFEELETLEAENKRDLRLLLNERERYYVNLFDSYVNGYNSDLGGNSHEHSEETKRKISETLKGKTLGHKDSEITKQRRSAALKGRTITEEARIKASNTQKAKQLRWYTNGVENLLLAFNKEIPDGFYLGKTISEEQKHRCRTQTIGYKHTDETRANMSKAGHEHRVLKRKELTMNTIYQLEKINIFVQEITAVSSKKAKQQILDNYKEDTVIKSFLRFLMDPYVTTGIGRKKAEKPLPEKSQEVNNLAVDFLQLFSWLEEHNTGDYAAIKKVRQFVDQYPTYKDLILDTITKSLRLGVDAKTINKEIPDLIPTFNVQLANKYFDKPEYVEGKTFALTTKIDGGRIIALKENGQVSFYTRAGQKYEGLVDLEDEMSRLIPDNTCLDGEITLLDRGNLSSKDAYKETMKIVRTKDKEKHGIKMLVFDCMTAEEFKNQNCKFTYLVRRADAELLFNQNDFQYFELLPILYRGSDTSKITELLEEEVANGEEGIMINICDALYDFKRTNNLLKVKKFDSLDLEVVDLEEGSGRLTGTLGAIHVRYKGGNIVKVGSGFSDEERKLYWSQPELIMNKVVEIKFFEETTNSDKTYSLRFPTWCSNIRTDKLTPDF